MHFLFSVEWSKQFCIQFIDSKNEQKNGSIEAEIWFKRENWPDCTCKMGREIISAYCKKYIDYIICVCGLHIALRVNYYLCVFFLGLLKIHSIPSLQLSSFVWFWLSYLSTQIVFRKARKPKSKIKLIIDHISRLSENKI